MGEEKKWLNVMGKPPYLQRLALLQCRDDRVDAVQPRVLPQEVVELALGQRQHLQCLTGHADRVGALEGSLRGGMGEKCGEGGFRGGRGAGGYLQVGGIQEEEEEEADMSVEGRGFLPGARSLRRRRSRRPRVQRRCLW